MVMTVPASTYGVLTICQTLHTAFAMINLVNLCNISMKLGPLLSLFINQDRERLNDWAKFLQLGNSEVGKSIRLFDFTAPKLNHYIKILLKFQHRSLLPTLVPLVIIMQNMNQIRNMDNRIAVGQLISVSHLVTFPQDFEI